MDWKLPDNLNFLLNFLSFHLILIGNYLGHQFFLRAVIADGLLHNPETSFPHQLVIKDQKLMLMAIQLLGNN